MDKLFTKVSQLLKSGARLEIYSSLTQNLVDTSNILLWNDAPLSIDDETYLKFKESIKHKSCKFYNHNKILPYHDFCIALLCCAGYSLNHNVTPQITARTYFSAWRSMTIIADTADENVKGWLTQHIAGRNNNGYSSITGITLDNTVIPKRRESSDKLPPRIISDDDIISKACMSRNVIDIYKLNIHDISDIIYKSTRTPEGQLDNLSIVHDCMRKR